MKTTIAVIALLAVGPAMFLLGSVLLPVLGQTYAVIVAGLAALIAWISIVSWFKRQFDDWWKHVQ